MKEKIKQYVNVAFLLLLVFCWVVMQDRVKIITEGSTANYEVPLESANESESVTDSETETLIDDSNISTSESATATESQTNIPGETGAVAEETEKGQSEVPYQIIIGFLTDFDMNKIHVLMDNGEEKELPLEGASIDLHNGFSIGNLITVAYTDDLEAPDIVYVADSAEAKQDQTDPKETKKVAGKLKNIGIGTMTVTVDKEGDQEFKTVYTSIFLEKWLAKGADVIVTYAENADEKEALIVENN